MKFCGSFPHRSPQNARPCLWGKWGDFPSASGRPPPLRRHLCRSPRRLVTLPWARGRMDWTLLPALPQLGGQLLGGRDCIVFTHAHVHPASGLIQRRCTGEGAE